MVAQSLCSGEWIKLKDFQGPNKKIFKKYLLRVSLTKANHFLNKSASENPLSRNGLEIWSFKGVSSVKCMNLRSF